MLRMTRLASKGTEIVVKVEGRLVAELVPLLEKECQALMRTTGNVRLDLEAVTYLDARAAQRLMAIVAAGGTIVRATPFVEAMLTGEEPS